MDYIIHDRNKDLQKNMKINQKWQGKKKDGKQYETAIKMTF